jgi:alcohol dehydrogenase
VIGAIGLDCGLAWEATVNQTTSTRIGLPRTILVGRGAIGRISALMTELGVRRPLIVTDSYFASGGAIASLLDGLESSGVAAALWSGTVPDPTSDSLIDCLDAARAHCADSVIGVGGGSSIDTAKAVALQAAQGGRMHEYKAPRNNVGPALPVIAVPTTAGSGSEVTQFTIITDNATDEKMLCAGSAFLPVAAIVDADLTVSMPPRLTADTGIDALTHAIESYVSKKANPFSDSLALVAIETIGRTLRRVYADGADIALREQMALAATQAGIAFSNASVALVHGMSRPIGAHFHVAHGLSNAMLLPAVTAFSASAAESRYADCARAFGVAGLSDSDGVATAKLVDALQSLCRDLAVPTPMDYGIDRAKWVSLIPTMAQQALASGSPANNPRVPTAEQISQLYEKVYC